jgi:hypothetical protein
MPAEIIDGRKIAAEIQVELKQRIQHLQEKGVNPKLMTILVGDDPASLSYLRGIARTCGEVGVLTETAKLPATIVQSDLLKKIEELNQDPKVHGILLFLPLPKHLNTLEAESAISPYKDVDGTNPISAGKLLLGEETFFPSTPYGVQELLVRSGHSPEGKHVVIVGLTISAVIALAFPIAAIKISACCVIAATFLVPVWHTVTVAFAPFCFCTSMPIKGFPTILLRPTMTTCFPSGLCPLRTSNS